MLRKKRFLLIGGIMTASLIITSRQLALAQGNLNPNQTSATTTQDKQIGLELTEIIRNPDETENTTSPSGYDIEQMGNYIVTNKIMLGPTKTSLVLDPGATQTIDISFISYRDATKKILFAIEDTQPNQDNGNLNFLGTQASPYSAKSWIQLPINEFIINPGEKITLHLNITVPENADAGDHYAALIMTEDQATNFDDTAVGVSIVGRSASNILITVTGNIRQEGELKEFTFNQNFFRNPPALLSNWAKTQPVSFNIVYQNRGSVHIDPSGEIVISDFIGREIGTAPVDDFSVLRESTRSKEVYTALLDPETNTLKGVKLNFGFYKARLNLTDNLNQFFIAETGFWYWPMPATGIVILSLMAVIAILLISHHQKKQRQKANRKRRTTQED